MPQTSSTREFPLITVVIPVHNAERWIDQTLLSVFAQSYRNIETIIIDDGSSDRSVEVIRHLAKCNPRQNLKVISIKNSGVSFARNLGMKEANGEFIAFLDSDDVWSSDKLLTQVEFMQSNPQCVAVLCDLFISKNNHLGQIINMRVISKQGVQDIGKSWLSLEGNGALLSSTALVYKSKVDGLIEFDTSLGTTADLSYYLQLSNLGEIGHILLPLVQYRQHVNQMHTNSNFLKKDFSLLLEQIATFPRGLSKKRILGNVFIMSSLLNLSKRKYKHAFIDLKTGVLIRPSSVIRIPVSIVYKRIKGFLALAHQKKR